MKKQLILGFALLAMLILLGAECTKTNNGENTEGAETSSPPVAVNQKENKNQNNEFTLNATALGNRVVKFSWTVPESMDAKGGFRVLHSAQPEPKYPGSYWYWLNSSTREATWGNLPAGNRNFRLCQFRSGKCIAYTNEIQLEVK